MVIDKENNLGAQAVYQLMNHIQTESGKNCSTLTPAAKYNCSAAVAGRFNTLKHPDRSVRPGSLLCHFSPAAAALMLSHGSALKEHIQPRKALFSRAEKSVFLNVARFSRKMSENHGIKQ